ncbi:MAG: GNAT family N-acetyltransferase [Bifidobacteriaceae bacterium]|nr:GNAT family N-acetyltransferase [Bifidobacteriaceae bacterium]
MGSYSLAAKLCELTPFQPEDTQRVFDYCQDSDIQRWTAVPVPYGPKDATSFVEGASQNGWDWETGGSDERVWAIRVRADGASILAGSVGLRPDPPGQSLEIGYLLAPDCRGRGLASDAVLTVTAHALRDLGMRRVLWRAAVGNWGSRRVAERCGFRVEGAVRSQVVIRGDVLDGWIGTALAEDLPANHGRANSAD